MIVDKAIKEDEDGDISSDTLKAAHDLVDVLRAKLAAEPLEGAKARDEASRFIKTLAGLVRLLERPDTTDAFNQLRHGQDHAAQQPDRVHGDLQPAIRPGHDPRLSGDLPRPLRPNRRGAKASRQSTLRRGGLVILSNLNPVFEFLRQSVSLNAEVARGNG